ncbi:MAG: PEP-utilizing enzyme [Thermodesulfobacteriota bacterium]|nr:PEP-utilizing enzyme [Thermodesulfobacteriota bacterium]
MINTIIIDSSYGVRFLDSKKSYPTSLKKIRSNESALDWNIAALKKEGISSITYIGGYHMEKVVQQYPDLHYHFHSNWEKEGTLKALLDAEYLVRKGGLVIDGRSVFRPKAVKALLKERADLVFGIEPVTEGGTGELTEHVLFYPNKAGKKIRFAGLIKCSYVGAGALIDKAKELTKKDLTLELHDLVRELLEAGVDVQLVDLTGYWSSLTRPGELARFVLGSKAQTLERLQPLLKTAVILDQVRFTVREWQTAQGPVLEKIGSHLKTERLVVRSSALVEDAWLASNAGRFKSVLDVDAGSTRHIKQAVEKVIASYRENGAEEDGNQVLIQPFVDSTVMCGVLFTRDIETRAPYYVINYHVTERTDTVTAGTSDGLKTVLAYKKGDLSALDERLLSVIEMAREVETLVGYDSLDIEFAMHESGRIYVLQVRPIAAKRRHFIPTDDDFDFEITEAKRIVAEAFQLSTNLLGKSSLLSNMSDWNPAEMIGTHPRLLAISLYHYLITDRVWGEARKLIGYRDTYPSPLMIVVSGQPYIDLRVSFNSFIPAEVSGATAEKCVNGYLGYLAENPEYHDKIEFEVAVTCFTFDFDEHSRRLFSMGLAASEIEELKRALLIQTDRIIKGEIMPIGRQLDALKEMERRRVLLIGASDSRVAMPARIKQLLDDCSRYGTLPFSILARYGFIALAILRSLKNKEVLTEEEYEACLHIPTIATEIADALELTLNGSMSREEFLGKYGHLRPGTYDILSPNYREAAHVYLNPAIGKRSSGNCLKAVSSAWELLETKFSQIEDMLNENGMKCTPSQLREFIFAAVSGREFAKFEFTKNVNLALEWITKLNSYWGLDKDQLSHLSIHDILNWTNNSRHSAISSKLRRLISFEKKRYELNQSIKLPHLIRTPGDSDSFELLECKPNFVTSKTVSGEVILLEEHATWGKNIKGKIVAIRNADPGFDWIFVHGIAGLITQYGGVASHMAIRAAEFGLPAAIGCGEILFKRVSNSRFITLDCSSKRVNIID